MCRGLGALQRRIMAAMDEVAKPARFTRDGEDDKRVRAVWVEDLCRAVYGEKHTRSEFVQVDSATRRLARTGHVERLLVEHSGTRGIRLRAYVAISQDEP